MLPHSGACAAPAEGSNIVIPCPLHASYAVSTLKLPHLRTLLLLFAIDGATAFGAGGGGSGGGKGV